MHHNYWACALEPVRHNYWSPCAATTEAHVPRACALQQEKPPQWEAHAPQQRVASTHRNWRKPARSNEDPTQPKINKLIKKKKKKKQDQIHPQQAYEKTSQEARELGNISITETFVDLWYLWRCC